MGGGTLSSGRCAAVGAGSRPLGRLSSVEIHLRPTPVGPGQRPLAAMATERGAGGGEGRRGARNNGYRHRVPLCPEGVGRRRVF